MTETKARRKRPWLVWLGLSLLAIGLLLVLFSLIPLPINSLIRGAPEDVERAYVMEYPGVWGTATRTSVDASPEARKELLEALETTRIRWSGLNGGMSAEYGEHIYSFTLCGTLKNEYAVLTTVYLDEKGNLSVGGSSYTGDTAALVDCVQGIWAAGESK